MYLDTHVRASRLSWWLACLFLVVVLALTMTANLHWWQYVALVLVALLLLFFHKNKQLQAISVKTPNELWQLGVDDELWQGYLNQAKLIDMGITKAVQLQFYMTEPQPMPYTVLIFRSMVSEADFRKLTTLVKVGGYLS